MKRKQSALCEVAGGKKIRKKKLAREKMMRIMRVPRLSRSANRFFKKQIKQCVWALAEMIGENQIINVSDSTIRKSNRETKH